MDLFRFGLVFLVFASVLALLTALGAFAEVLYRVIKPVDALLNAVYRIFYALRGVDVDIDRVTGFTGDQTTYEHEHK
jgi:hypothetical protein